MENNSLLDIISRYFRKFGYTYGAIKLQDELIGEIQSLSYSFSMKRKCILITANRICFDTHDALIQKAPYQIEINDGIHTVIFKNVWIYYTGSSFYSLNYLIVDNVKLEAEKFIIK